MKTKNPFMEAIIFFALFSVVLVLLAAAQRYHVLPFLHKSLPSLGGRKLIFQAAILLGLILPTIWLIMDWSKKPIRIALLAFLLMQGLQIATEFAVVRYLSPIFILPTAILYVGYRIIQVIRLQMLLFDTPYDNLFAKFIRTCIVLANLVLWGIVLFRFIVWRLPALF